MPIREMQEADLAQMTLVARRGLEFEMLDEALVREKTINAPDNDPSLGLVYLDEGRITAFAQGVMRGELDGKKKGCIRLFCVDRAYRRMGHGDVLFDELESRMKMLGAQVVTIMDDPKNYLTPGVDFRYTEAYCFLLGRGYKVFRENHSMACKIGVDQWPELDAQVANLQSDGIEIRRATLKDWPAIKTFLELEWAGWVTEVQSALHNQVPSVYIGLKDGEVIAFAGYQGNNKSQPFFGPMGTSEVLRGRGAGAVLMSLGLRDLARQGWDHAIIPWVGPVAFYARFFDAWIERCFWAYKKDL